MYQLGRAQRLRSEPVDATPFAMRFDAVSLRHALHRSAEIAGEERATAARIVRTLEAFEPDDLLTEVGGHGVIATFRGSEAGPRVFLRAELDALPMPEGTPLPYASASSKAAHKCGHDGHMTMVAGLAPRFRETPPRRGEVHLLFQPAEEVGRGAAHMLEDPRLSLAPTDWIFAAHNLPGHPLGEVVLREGTFAAASTGFAFHLGGTSSHAAEPERGKSPALAMAHLVSALSALPQTESALGEGGKVTVVHARLGDPAFGTSPGDAVVMATFRAYETALLDRLIARAERLAEGAATAHGLTLRTERVDPFPATINDREAVERLERAAATLGMRVVRAEAPFAWSEDFGHFTAGRRGALFGLGAGEEQPPLHHPSYDFPDALLDRGTDLLEAVTRACLDEDEA